MPCKISCARTLFTFRDWKAQASLSCCSIKLHKSMSTQRTRYKSIRPKVHLAEIVNFTFPTWLSDILIPCWVSYELGLHQYQTSHTTLHHHKLVSDAPARQQANTRHSLHTTTLQHYNFTSLQHYKTTTLRYYITTTLQHYNATTLQPYITTTQQHYIQTTRIKKRCKILNSK